MAQDRAGDEQRRTRARAIAAQIAAARLRAGLVLPDRLGAGAGRWRAALDELIARELAPGRLVPWLPVGFGFGIGLYFTADREPALWAALLLALAAASTVIAARQRALGLIIALGLAAIAAGFAAATFKTALIAHPVLRVAAYNVTIAGFVEVREEREKNDRIVLRVHRIGAARLAETLERVRVTVRKGTAPMVGEFVEFKARLSPPLQPLRPGGYDFARDMFFQRIGASGYVLGAIKTLPPPVSGGLWLRYAAALGSLREAIDDRIRAILPGDRGSIASALITGKRDAITTPVNDAMYISSLAHVLSISGYHMAVVAGIVFFFIRAGLALIPSFAIRHPIKKWAAIGAFVAATFYLLLSSSEVATQRSYIMIALVLLGVMFDRPALTFRTLTVAAFGVLLLAPQAVVHPSFQMSFAATLALVAAYQHGLPTSLFGRANADTSRGARVALWGVREVIGLVLASLVAGLATTPYAAFHFHRLAPYGVLANLLAMPVVSAWVMPMGILGVLALPFGFDAPFWQMMGWGLDWMMAVALWVASLPGAVGRTAAFGTGPLLLVTAGILLVCLLRTRLRWHGAGLILIAALWAVATPRPDVYVDRDGQAAALRGADGRLSILNGGRDTFAIKEWLAADADARSPRDESLKAGVRCDDIGCIVHLPDGRLASMVLSVEAFAEDCARAALVVSPRPFPGASPGDCHALLLDRRTRAGQGAITLYRSGEGFTLRAARPRGYERPWAPAQRETQRAPVRPASRDATPRSEDLEAGD
jgi:competence protein ComEC